ncbi:MAG TPA: helix-turn-helix transcriptional regulator [Candidatus Elarobacter sp.]|nr:helix-turn-helix transcriptional regulator [Candidatus Elarobacter sp.]
MSRKKRDPEVSLRRLGDTLRAQREAAGRTQEAVAFAAEVSVRHYQKIESGITNPAFLTLLQIADALEVRLPDLLGDLR